MGLSCAMVQSAINRVPYGRVPIELDVHGSAVAFSRDSSDQFAVLWLCLASCVQRMFNYLFLSLWRRSGRI